MSALKTYRRSRRLWLAAAIAIAVAVVGAVAVTTSRAAGPCPIPGNFEIDGDMSQQTCTPGADDWNTPNIGVVGTNQGGTYSTAGKDGSDPSTWTSSGSTPDKTNFNQAYATSRTVQVNGSPHFFVFVAWERTSTSGTQGYAIELTNSGANVAADGTPQPNRGNGGSVFYISAQGGSAPSFDGSCTYTSQSDYGSTCSNSQAGFYSAFNSTAFTDPLSGLPVAASGFYEVALDVTALTGIVPSCPGATAATVYLRSITGQTKNGNLKGYMAPLEVAPDSTCVPPPITTTATPGGSQAAIGSTQHDTVTVGTQQAPGSGTVKFFLCSPAEVTANSGDCKANGTQVGSDVTLVNGQGSSANVNAGSTPNDLAVGKYCWRAEFTPDANDHHYLPGSETNSLATGAAGDECFIVVKNTTLIGTAASSQTIGAAIHDVATLSGATANAGGTITFNAYGPSDSPDCSGNPVFTATVNVSGNGNYNSGDFTPSTAGKYYWIASYSGDGSNLASTGTCGDQGETSTVGKKTTLIATAATSGTLGDAVHDVATLSGATATAGGTITFNLYGPSASPNCSGAVVYTNTVSVSGPGDYNSGNFTPTTAGKYYWIASYSGDVNNLPSTGTCGDQGETSTLLKRPTAIVTAATDATIGDAVHDVATLSGASADAGGTITFSLYGPSASPDCSGTAVFTATVNVSGNGNYNSGDFTPTTAGKYYWIASYSGDVNNLPSTGTCGDQGETSTIGKKPTGITTAATNAAIGSAVHDIATLSGATANAGGTITFNLYGPSDTPDCSGNPVFTATVNVSGNGNYNSGDFTPSTAGKYYWIASYSGDVNNQPSSGTCGDSGETSTVGKQPTAIVTAATSGTLGDAVHDIATLSGGHSPTGTITFNLYGPSSSPDCSGTPVYTKTVSVSGNGDYNSGNFTPTTAGKYYWIASYSGDVNNQPSSGTCGDSGETSTLEKRPTAIVTAATDGTIGDAVHDIATLSGASADAGGTITFSLYGPSDSPDCSGTAVYNNTVSVSGNGDYNSGNFTPTTAGKYYWIASYSGDVNNLPSSGTCGDQGETSTLTKKPTSISTAATNAKIGDAVHDIATLSGATADAGGTITFSLYGPSDTPDCSGNAVFTSTVSVDGPGDYNSGDFTPSTAGKYYWIASYSGDVNNQPSTGACGDQGETSTIGTQPTGISTAATDATIGGAVHDIATLSGATADAGGTITFSLYGPSDTPDCSGDPVYTNTVDVNGPGDYNSGNFTPDTAGKYYWIASYSGDVNNQPSTGACGDQGETSTIAKQPTSISTAATSGSLGDAIHDVATLAGGNSPGGEITFSLYGPSDTPDCSGEPVFTDTVSVDGNGDYQSSDFTPTTAGTYYWIASYSGDVNNEPSTGTCGDEGETSTIKSADTRIVKTPDAAKVNVGSPIGFTMTVYNAGAGDAHGVKLSDTLPTNAGLSWTIDKQGTGWGANGCSIKSGVLTCGPVTVPGGTTQAASTFTVHITSPTAAAAGGDCPGSGTVNNTGSVTTTNDGSGQASASTCVQALVDLSITKAGSPAEQTLGEGNITWTIVVTNHGPSADTGITITDPMPAGNTFVSASSTQGTCTGGAVLTCNIGDMAAGASVTITLVTKPSAAGNQVNTVTVSGNRPETNTGNNQASATVLVKGFTPPVVYCVAVSKVTPKQLFVGRKTKLTIHVTQHGKAKAGVHVLIRGPHFLKRTKASNAKGVIKQTVKMKKAGAMIFSPIASKRCNTKRIGITNVFTPPVTG